jgi:predicted DCC family thiol-disulfide oxidoreductase YuxK
MATSILLDDGHCRLCIAGSEQLLRLARPGAIERRDFQQPGVLAAFPGLSYETCMEAMQLVTPEGRIYAGAEAAARALLTRGPVAAWAYPYYVPGLRHLADWAYGWIARHRYLLRGRDESCESEGCALHLGKRPLPVTS